MAKTVETVKFYRASDGATKEVKKSVATPYYREQHARKGFRVVEEFPAEEKKAKVDNPAKPVPNVAEEIAKAKEAEAPAEDKLETGAEGTKEELEPDSPEEAQQLDALSVKELKALADERGVEYATRVKKDELIALLS